MSREKAGQLEQVILKTACGAMRFATVTRDSEGKVPSSIMVPLMKPLGLNRFVESWNQFGPPKFTDAQRKFVPFTSIWINGAGHVMVYVEEGTYTPGSLT